MKTIRLWVYEWVKVVIALAIPLYYRKMISFSAGVWNFPLFLLILVLLGTYFFKSKREKADEAATKAMLMANSLCYKLSLALMTLGVLPFTIVYGADPANIGNVITFGIFGLVVVRAIAFCWFDKVGVK